jgi:hypothetical protein
MSKRLLSCALFFLLACGGDDDSTADVTWQGEEPHASFTGRADGHDIAVDVVAATCKLKYTVPNPDDAATWNQAVLDEFEIAVQVVDGGVEKAYEIEFVAADFIGASGEMAVPRAVQAEVSFEWEQDNTAVNYEQSASEGTLLFAALLGTPGPDGKVIPAGMGTVGGAFALTLPDGGELAGSFTAPCTETEVAAAE